jgi:hypothetical protein
MRELVKGTPGVDVLGVVYEKGDMIAAAINSYGAPTLLVGTVVGFTENRVRVTPLARTNYAYEERDSSISPERVVKISTPTPEPVVVGAVEDGVNIG